MAKVHQLVAQLRDQGAEHRPVGVVDLPISDRGAHRFYLIAGRQNANPQLLVDVDRLHPNAGEYGNLRGCQASSCDQDSILCLDVFTGFAGIGASFQSAVQI